VIHIGVLGKSITNVSISFYIFLYNILNIVILYFGIKDVFIKYCLVFLDKFYKQIFNRR